MKGLLKSKLVLSLAALIMIAAAIAIPLSGAITRSHAAAPKGEQPLSVSASHVLSSITAGAPISITTDCSSPTLQLIASLSKGDLVSGTATLTSSDPNEASENENLHLQEQNSQFTKPITTVTINNSPQSFSFIAGTNQDTLTACVDVIDSDETPTVTVIIIPAPKLDLARSVTCEASATLKGEDKGLDRECSLANQEVPDQVVGCTFDSGQALLEKLLGELIPLTEPILEGIDKAQSAIEFARAKTNLERLVVEISDQTSIPTSCINGLIDLISASYHAVETCLADTTCTNTIIDAIKHGR